MHVWLDQTDSSDAARNKAWSTHAPSLNQQPECHVHKFVDDTTLTEVLGVDLSSRRQDNLNDIVTKSADSFMNINVREKKNKETRLGAGASKQQYQDLILEGNVVKNVTSYKLLGIHVWLCVRSL